MSDLRVRRRGNKLVHAVLWSDNEGGRVRCGPYFTLCHNDARVVEEDCDCMSCLARPEGPPPEPVGSIRALPGQAIINVRALRKLEFIDEE